jgi:hypothetical protein
MFRSEKIRDADTGLPLPSAAAIAASVKRTAEHQALAQEIAELSDEREQIVAEMRALIATNSNELNDKSIARAGKKRGEAEGRLNALLREVRAHRDTHSRSVAEALRPQGVEAAKAMVESLHMFVTAAQKFNACQDEIGRAGGEPERIYIAPAIGAYENLARCFLERDG